MDWNTWLTIRFSLLAEPWLGAAVEVPLILIWIGSWALIGFVATDVGYRLEEFEPDMHVPIAVACVGWIVYYITAMFLMFIVRTRYCSRFAKHRLIQARLFNLTYHLFRWPIFVGFLACPNEACRFSAFAFDWYACLVALSILIPVYFCSK